VRDSDIESDAMSLFFRIIFLGLALASMIFPDFLMIEPAQAQTQRIQPQRSSSSEIDQKERMNAWTVGLAAGQLEGAPIRFATEIARVVDDGQNMIVLPIVTRGPVENLNDLLYLRGVDMAIVNSDALEEYKAQVPDIQNRVAYLLNLFPSELHIFVRPEVQSLQDLAGKKVNFNTQGTAAAYTGPIIFSRLGVEVEKTFIPHQAALEQMRKGEMSAVVFITTKPVDAFVRGTGIPASNSLLSITAPNSKTITFRQLFNRVTILL
jgi:TRAP-type uncharacterized transport system substrate-binding protein